ncbi:MAG: hypothetical protein GF346_10090, partial [Candidatus Eisenbacteria bacterium]|nr:hypothetical protein [Candidatus Latescibacterota bacterium]MBD3302784.1 hypothetical protein [Candidatus Eisenbacteria bacterium]
MLPGRELPGGRGEARGRGRRGPRRGQPDPPPLSGSRGGGRVRGRGGLARVSATAGGSGESRSGSARYRDAGVSLERGQESVRRIRQRVRSTFGPRVESQIGSFGGFFAYPEAGGERLLVSSMDGVGTKLRLAAVADRWEGVGYDLVSHCVNDILVHAARPLFFLDYIGAGSLDPDVVERVIAGLAGACEESGCALIGGETAEMPGMYPPGELDLVGCIVGDVGREEIVDGRRTVPGDRLLG